MESHEKLSYEIIFSNWRLTHGADDWRVSAKFWIAPFAVECDQAIDHAAYVFVEICTRRTLNRVEKLLISTFFARTFSSDYFEFLETFYKQLITSGVLRLQLHAVFTVWFRLSAWFRWRSDDSNLWGYDVEQLPQHVVVFGAGDAIRCLFQYFRVTALEMELQTSRQCQLVSTVNAKST